MNLVARERALIKEALRMARSEGQSAPGSPGWTHEVLTAVNESQPATISMLRNAYLEAAEQAGIKVSLKETFPRPKKVT